MKSVLIRAGSGSISSSPWTGPPRFPVPVHHDSFSGGEKLEFSPLTVNNSQRISRAMSEPQTIAFPGFGSGSGRDRDGFGFGRSSGGSNNNNERNRIGAHYQKLLESSPNDPLVLRNYGKFLHEVEGDSVKAEECYGRAILASPGDGELLSLYGKLIWEVDRDGERARSYFDQAINASPDNCMVMGSYAQFMWEAEEDEHVEEESGSKASGPAAQAICF